MEMTGEQRIPAPRQTVWDALNDPEVLRAAIPGCESVQREGDDQFVAKVALKIGPMAARFGGKVKLENINAPVSYTITGEGNGGAMGFAKGGADVSLEEISPTETLLKYAAKAQVGGKMAQLGGRLIDSTAKSMADKFFASFANNLAAQAPAAVAPVVEAAPAPAEAPLEAPAPSVAEPAPSATPVPPAPVTAAPVTSAPATAAPATAAPVVPAPSPKAAPAPAAPPARRGLPTAFWIGLVIFVIIVALIFLSR